ncbi:MAG TPA: hypothetical protein VF832_00885 [Longimicrobiales bacterium]
MAIAALLLPFSMLLSGCIDADGQTPREAGVLFSLTDRAFSHGCITAWVDEDGTVHFLHDVYGRDQQLEPERQRQLEHPVPAGRLSAAGAEGRSL